MPTPEAALEFVIRRGSDVTLAAMTVATSSRCLNAFAPDERTLLGTVVSELASNILKYAGHGVIHVEPLLQDGRSGVRIRAIDQGPGIADVEACMRDGFSTGGTLGLGLPAVRRIMDSVRIHCPEGGGTQVEAFRWARGERGRIA
jgi:serine/threonine-protein kinase RsbT